MHKEGVVEEELVHRMASKWEKMVDKGALLTLGHQLIICGTVGQLVVGMKSFVSLLRIVGLVSLKVWILTAIQGIH